MLLALVKRVVRVVRRAFFAPRERHDHDQEISVRLAFPLSFQGRINLERAWAIDRLNAWIGTVHVTRPRVAPFQRIMHARALFSVGQPNDHHQSESVHGGPLSRSVEETPQS